MSNWNARREKSIGGDESQAIAHVDGVDDRDGRSGPDDGDALDAVGFEHERVHRVVEERDRAGRVAVAADERRVAARSRGTVPGAAA